jgi:diguanylate cyclase (GGDEF)-like protein/PAS domain S-box-containing protein
MRTPRFEFGSPPMDITGGTEDLLDVGMARRLCEHSPLGILLADGEGCCFYSNAACQKIIGLTFGQALGKPWSDSVHPDDRRRAVVEWRKAMQEGRKFLADVRVLRPDASQCWARLHASTVHGGSKPSAYVLMVEDITEQKAAEAVLREAEERLFEEKERAQVTLDSIGDAVLATDLVGNLTYMNVEAESLTGWSSEEALGRPLTDVFHIVDGETLAVARNPARQAIEEDRTVGLALGCLLLRRDSTGVAIEDSAAPIHNRDGSVAGAVIVFHDAAQSRAIAKQNAHLAWHDQLTGLPDITLLTERLTQAIGLAHRHCSRIGLLFIDLDQFKRINDTHGHLVGDELLKSVAMRLENSVRVTDTVCRRSGDEFVILLSELTCREDAAYLAGKILAAFAAPHVLNSVTVEIDVSIGISVYPDDGEDSKTLMQCADTAMYEAKAINLHGYCFAGADHPRPATGWRVGRLPRAHGVERQATVIPKYLKLEKSS